MPRALRGSEACVFRWYKDSVTRRYLEWINGADAEEKTAGIFLLEDVAGSGKSAIAHTVAQRCRKHHILASSFFFNRDTPERRGPQLLFSTIARDLATLTKGVRNTSIAPLRKILVLLLRRNLVNLTNSSWGHFTRHRANRPIVLVIDALDEGCDSETVAILRSEVPKLPAHSVCL